MRRRTLRKRDTSHQSRRRDPDFVAQGGGVLGDAEVAFWEISRPAAWHKFRCGGVYWVLSRLLAWGDSSFRCGVVFELIGIGR